MLVRSGGRLAPAVAWVPCFQSAVLAVAWLALLSLSPPAALAQDEFLLNDDRISRNQWEPAVARGATGTIVAAWQDGRNGTGSFEDFDIYSLTIRSAFSIGTTLNRRLNDDPAGRIQSNPDVAASPAGTFFCVWIDSRLGDRDVFGCALDSLGIPIGPNVRVSEDLASEDQFSPRVVAVGPDRYFVVWGDGRDGQGEIFGAMRTAEGAAIGGPFRISDDPLPGGSFQGDPSCAAGPGGEILVIWSDGRNGATFGATFDIYGQWLDPTGAPIGGNFKVNDAVGVQNATSPDAAANALGFVAGWTDRRRAGDPGDVWCQRYQLDRSPLGPNALVNDDPPGSIQISVHACDTPTGALFVWEDLRGGLGLDSNVEAAHIPSDGGPPSPNFRVNATLGARQGNPEAVWDGVEAAVVVWEDLRRGSSDIFCVAIRPDGVARGADTQLNDDAAPFDQRRARLGKGRGRYLATWFDLRSSGSDLFAQWITAAGAREGPNQRLWDDNFTERPVAAASAVAPSGDALAVAQITRSSDAGDVRGFLVSPTSPGVVTGSWIGDELPSSQALPRAAGAPDGFGVAWLDSREGVVRLYAQRLALDGARIGGNHAVLAAEPADPIFDFDLAPAPGGGYWLLYAEGAGASQRLWLVRLDGDLFAAGPPLELAAAIPGSKRSVSVDLADDGRLEIVWRGDGADGSGQVYHLAFSTQGASATPLGAPLLLTPPQPGFAQTSPSLSVDGSFSAVVWAARPQGDWSVWMQRIQDGVTPAGPAIQVDQDLLGADQLEPTVAVDGGGNILTIWTDARSTSSGTDILGRVMRFLPTSAGETSEEPPPTPSPAPPPAMLRVGRPKPNPFVTGLGIALEVPESAAPRLTIGVYNARGERIRLLHDGPAPAAASILRWDGRDGEGRRVPGGVYWIAVAGGGERHVRRVVHLR